MANLYFEAQLDADQLRRELRDINQRFANMANNAQQQGDKMDATMKKVGAAMAGYFTLTAAQDFIGQVVNVRGEFQQLDIALQTMLGNKEKADNLMANVVQLAAKTPFSLTELGQGAKQLLAFKTPAEEIPDTLKRIGDVAAGVSVPVGDLIAAYGKVSAKGKMQAEELNQFAERGVPIISELAKVIGTTDDKIYKMAETGQIGFGHLQQAVKNMTNETGMFYNLMEKQSASLTGQLSNLGDAWDRMLNDIGQNNEGVISDVIGGLTNMVENYEDILKVLGVVVATYGAYRAALMLAAMAQKAQAVAGAVQAWLSLASGIRSAKDAQIAFSLATKMNPWGLAAAGIAALVGGLMLFGKEIRSAEEGLQSFKDLSEEIDKTSSLEKMVSEYESLSKIQNKSAEEQTRYNDLLKQLAPLYDDAITKVDEYGNAVALSADKMKQANKETRDNQIISLQAQIDLSKKAIDKAKNDEELARRTTSRKYTVYDNLGQSRTVERSPELVNKSFNEVKKAQAIAATETETLEGLQRRLALITGELEDYYSKYASLLGDVSDKSKKELIGLQQQVKTVLSGEIKDSQFRKSLEDQATAIGNALDAINEAANKANQYDGKDYRKKLGEKEKAYDDYVEAMKDPRAKERDALEKHYASLKSEGDNYKDYLLKQLDAYKGNTDAIAAIYQAAAKGGVILNGKEELKPMTGNTDTSKVKVTDIKRSAAVPLEFKKLADYSESAKLNAEKLRKEMGMLSKAEIGAGLIEGANAMSEMARYAGQMDEELGKVLNTTADLVGNVGNMMAGFSSGDIMGTATGIMGVVSTVSSLFDDSAKKQAEAARKAENYRQQLVLQNKELEYQLDLMNRTSGKDRVQAEKDTLALIEKQIAALDKSADNSAIEAKLLNGKIGVDVSGIEELEKILNGGLAFDTDKLFGRGSGNIGKAISNEMVSSIQDGFDEIDLEALNNNGFNIENIDQLEEYVAQFQELKDQRAALFEQFTATSSTDITDSIIEGFRNGESAIENFSNMFEDTMRESLIESFKNTVVLAESQKVYDLMKKAVGNDGIISVDEMAGLKEQAATSAEVVQSGMEQYNKIMQDVFGESLFESGDSAKESGMAGSIRAEMTEETASRLAGLFNVMSLDTRSIRDNMTLNLANNVQQLNQLLAIELNTGKTAANTGEAVIELKNAVTELRKVSKNTSSNIRGEG
jgi:tape measure domain-containing protein